MAPKDLPDLTKDDLATLRHLSDLLHLFHHRNKNQHRRSIWWRHFSTFRRNLNHLLQDLTDLQKLPETHLQRTRKAKKDQAREERISQRLVLWQDVLVPKWQHAFSQIVADSRFATLGVMLLATLAQVCRVLGVTGRFEELGQVEVERVLEDFGREYWAGGERVETVRDGDEDLGEVVAREGMEGMAQTGGGEVAVLTVEDQNASTKAVKRKKNSDIGAAKVRKKKKKGNAIDDLFGGLD